MKISMDKKRKLNKIKWLWYRRERGWIVENIFHNSFSFRMENFLFMFVQFLVLLIFLFLSDARSYGRREWKMIENPFDEFWLSCGLKMEEGFCYRHANASTPICKFTHAIIPILTHAVYFFTLHCVCHGTIISRMEINVIWTFLMNWTSMINIYLNTLFNGAENLWDVKLTDFQLIIWFYNWTNNVVALVSVYFYAVIHWIIYTC